VVSRGGRPTLQETASNKLNPKLRMMAAGLKKASNSTSTQRQMTNKNKLIIIPNAIRLFEESGKLQEAAKYSTEWFKRFLHLN
jgi:hypothetical protein